MSSRTPSSSRLSKGGQTRSPQCVDEVRADGVARPPLPHPSSISSSRNSNIKSEKEQRDSGIGSLGSDLGYVSNPSSISSSSSSFPSHVETSSFKLPLPQVTDSKFYRPDVDGDTPLHIAACTNENAVLYLINKAVNPHQLNCRNKLFQCPIHLASMVNFPLATFYLILGGANITLQDGNGNTPLHIACKRGFLSCVRRLLTPAKGDDPPVTTYDRPEKQKPPSLETRNYDGFTSFHLAAMHRRPKVLLELIYADKNIVDAKDGSSGRTALHHAVEWKDIEMVAWLVEKCNADVNVKANDGSTPLCSAQGRGYGDIATFLLNKGADASEGFFKSSETDSEEPDSGFVEDSLRSN